MSNGAGRTLAVLPLGGPAADGTVTTTIRRADLYDALHAAAVERGIPIEYGRQLADWAEHPGGSRRRSPTARRPGATCSSARTACDPVP